ncbi:putative receptor-like protein kinase [Quercus suber]|uniref:Receptor-like protein kinase n=1 Tax=Quercus suber TaxID=58331 RepID=A0AAW0KQ00_QUESU
MSLRNCSKMYYLAFVSNRFEGVLPSSIGNLSTQLTELLLGRNKISGTIPVALQNLINLIVLGMDENLFTGMIPTCFGRFQKMQGLNLLGNKLSGKIPSSIGNLTQLADLFLSQNNLEGSIPPSIRTCQSLQQLDVAENYLSGVIPQQDFRHTDVDMQKCLLSVLNIGILCSLESPKERINMEEVIKELQMIKSTFLGLGIRKGRPSRAQRCSNWVSVVKP